MERRITVRDVDEGHDLGPISDSETQIYCKDGILYSQLGKLTPVILADLRTGSPIHPVGVVHAFAGQDVPYGGWRWCDGHLLPVANYPQLFATIGHMYDGSANVQTNTANGVFAVPNLVGRHPRGASQEATAGSIWGADTIQIEKHHLPTHEHQASSIPEVPTTNASIMAGRPWTAMAVAYQINSSTLYYRKSNYSVATSLPLATTEMSAWYNWDQYFTIKTVVGTQAMADILPYTSYRQPISVRPMALMLNYIIKTDLYTV